MSSSSARNGSLELGKLHSTLFSADGDGPKTVESLGKRNWYGRKREQDSAHGMTETEPVPTVKHRKFALFKKVFKLGNKLKPLGVGEGNSGANYDGQAETREQEDEEPTATGSHVDQEPTPRSASGSHSLDSPEQKRDLFVQVVEARGLRGTDSRGSSDPYCRVRYGGRKAKTKAIQRNLSPRWNETFVFAAEASGSSPGTTQKISFEVWDSDYMPPDDFLGQAHLNLSEVTLKTAVVEPVWLTLYGEKHSSRVEGLGELKVAVWLAPAGQLGRLQHSGEAPRTKLTTLCSPPGVAKTLPMVVHTEGNCLYEEPCIHYLSLNVSEMRDLEQFKLKDRKLIDSASARKLPQSASSDDEAASPNIPALEERSDVPAFRLDDEIVQDTQNLLGGAAWRRKKKLKTAGNDAESSDCEESESDDELGDDGEDPFDDGEENLENPLQAPSSEANAAPPSASPLREKRLYFEVSFGKQRRRTRISRLKDGAFVWRQRLAFAAVVPIKDKPLKLLLCEVDRQNQRSRLLAIAFIPISKLLSASEQSEEGQWYRLHDYNKRLGGKPVSFGAVQLRLGGADADDRRLLFGIPLLQSPASGSSQELPMASRTVSSTSNASIPSSVFNEPTISGRSESSFVVMPPRTTLKKDEPDWLARKYGSSIAMYVGEKREDLEVSVISGSTARGAGKVAWHCLGLLLLLLQFLIAVSALLLRFQNNVLKRLVHRWRRTTRRLRSRTATWRRRRQAGAMPQPQKQLKPLGLVKVLLSSVELADQQTGSYFCLLKCGAHWGMTSLIKNTDHPQWHWEVHLPMYDPNTLLLLSIFKSQQRRETHRLRSAPPLHIGKLRIRLNSLQSGRQYNASLPMLADRKQGGHRAAMAHLQTKVIYFEEKAVVQKYFKAALPKEVYVHGFHEGNTAKQLEFEYRRLTLHWLESTSPAIPRLVAKSVLSNERQQFVFSRAKANWTRFMLEKERFTWIIRFWRRNQQWENPAESILLMCTLVGFCFYPHVVCSGVLLCLVAYSLLTAPKRPEKPPEMRADPQDADEDDEVADKGGITQLRRKYERLVRVALAVQNYLEDLANTMERLHAFINWADPKATLIFLTICLIVVLAMAAFSLPVVLSVGLCWTVRPPILRTPTPPAPLSFFLRLPTRADEII